MSAMFGMHPSDDELADLAAEVLPPGQARDVEAHVVACDRCADLLADSERVHRLLLADDPGPMPDDVWDRIELSLAAEVGARFRDVPAADLSGSEQQQPAFELGAPAPWDVPSAEAQPDAAAEGLPEAPTSQWNQFVLDAGAKEWDEQARTAHPQDPPKTYEADTDGASSGKAVRKPSREADPDFDDEDDEDSFAARHTPSRTRLPSRLPSRPNLRRVSSLRSRRDIRDEDRVSPLVRYGRPLGIAAGVVAIAGLAGYAVTIMPGGGDSSGSTSAGGAAAFSAASQEQGAVAPAAAAASAGADGQAALRISKEAASELLSASGTTYTKKDFAAQALALPQIGGRALDTATGSGGGSVGGSGGGSAGTSSAAAAVSPPAAPAPLTSFRAAAKGDVTKVAGNKGLIDPAVLAGCLAKIGRGDAQPIAVDLATYDGADAAIVVFAGPDGGYEVFVVRRSCTAESADALAYQDIPPK